MKKVLIISSSPVLQGNSDTLCDKFAEGAKAAGNTVEKIRLADCKINFCHGCGYCNSHGACVQNDDVKEIAEKMRAAAVIVLATPVYFYSVCGQLKTLIDRICPYYTTISNKDFYYIVTAADTSEADMQKTVETIRGFTLDCLNGAREKGIIYGLGVWHKGEILKKQAILDTAYAAGKNA